MSESYIGQITLFAGDFAPKNWAFCNGQLLQISTNSALFAVLGTIYGGDGRSTFALPDLRGRVPVHYGSSQGPGLSDYVLGQRSGTETVTLLAAQMPAHSHLIVADDTAAAVASPNGGNLAQAGSTDVPPIPSNTYTSGNPTKPVPMNPLMVQAAGGNQPHDNIQPLLAVNFIICLYGLFPSRN